MLKLSELQPGDIVMAEYEGQLVEGTVKELNKEDKEVCVETAVQEFWFKPEHLFPIPLSEEQLLKLGFQKVESDNGSVKYKKDSFRILLPTQGNFNDLEIWWREDRRHLRQAIHVHELQNHYYQMTKVELNPA
ncbi:hypothetical protein HB364_11290 [Pseudoflavitalea sp. X16]|uniref:hypothetical protein n=1 Tax=Paraflavitalea devenefica TaxID=2716334 RepID=UPI00141EEDA5|nr:hypothetical protein [Paraflavitalea devenefica]NII25671.1 hypothetical protein [Paraflavitalea devenefica]